MAVRNMSSILLKREVTPIHHHAMSVGQTYRDHNRNMVHQVEYWLHITATRILCQEAHPAVNNVKNNI